MTNSLILKPLPLPKFKNNSFPVPFIKVKSIPLAASLENKKSLTVRVTYGSDHKTLSGQEIDECEKVFLSNLSKKIIFDIILKSA